MRVYVGSAGGGLRRFETLAFFWAGVQAGGGKNLDLTMTAEASFSVGSGVFICVDVM